MRRSQARPTLFMVAGPNGAGKSTLYEVRIKPKTLAPFINADLIQRFELDDQSMAGAYRAAEVAEQRRRDHLASRKSFVSESTFSHPSKLLLLADAKRAGFRLVLHHVGVKSAELSVARVAHRVQRGGHDVPEDKIRERFERNQQLIHQACVVADRAFVHDNSVVGRPPRLLIELRHGKVHRVADSMPTWARTLYAKELAPTELAQPPEPSMASVTAWAGQASKRAKPSEKTAAVVISMKRKPR